MKTKAFTALRPAAAVAAKLASVPYDVVDTAEARALAAGNPVSFLHVSRPEIDLPDGTDIYSDAVYAQAVKALKGLVDGGALVRDPEPAYYAYRQIMGAHSQTGIVACCHIDDYAADVIRKHDKPWEGWDAKNRHPVYNFSMMRANGATVDKFLAALEKLVRDLCGDADVPYDPTVDATVNFGEFLKAATAKAKRYFFLFMKLIGADISGERQSARGRADAILKDKSGVYVFEFKYGKTPREALEQARAKDYAGPWLDGKPPVFYVGVNYDPAKRGIDDPLVEKA